MSEVHCNEEWRDMPETSGAYQVSSLGRIRSVDRFDKAGRSIRGRLLRFNSVKGYDGFSYYVVGKPQQTTLVHRVVAEVFIGTCPDGMQVNHKDGNRRNNAACNLEYVTPRDNTRHAWALGLCSAKGERNGRAKLTCQSVQAIRAACKNGSSNLEVAREFVIDPSTASQIVSGRRWGHLTEEM